MNILLLGNGFDLYHKLPTRYDNFLHTVDFLINNYTPEMTTVADVFGNTELQKEDDFIFDCYQQHKKAYSDILLDGKIIESIIEIAKNNKWYHYLLQTFDKQTGWIDFEKEIACVVKNFQILLSLDGAFFESKEIASKLDIDGEFIIQQFLDIITFCPNKNSLYDKAKQITPQYRKEYPLGSKCFIINKEKIVDELISEIKAFSKLLKLYLQIFIENTLDKIKQTSLKKIAAISHIDKAITFNYTSSYENFYLSDSIFHLHGNVNEKIILGINPDNTDKLETIDTTLVQFKKYFQRTEYNTDGEYIKWISELNNPNEHMSLLVMGHSLDITDKDIIVELFRKMDEINILYHNEKSKVSYISNLIRIFGKEEFDELRKKRKLTFLSQDMDFSEFVEKRKESSFARVIQIISNVI